MEWSFISWDFITALASIIMLDILLGGDNAVVIAMAANKLPSDLRKKAILIGTGGAVIIRLVMTLIAVWLLSLPYLQVLGGLILLPIAIKLLLPAEHDEKINASDTLMGAIRMNEDGEVGVFILKNDKVTFRKIEIIAEQDGYCIAREYSPDEEGYADMLHKYDNLIVSGKGLKEQTEPDGETEEYEIRIFG